MRRTLVLLLLILALSPLATQAQSFDCKLARSPREQAVCADTHLSALDAEIAANYKALRAQLSPESAALVQSDQREWLRWIDLVCPAHGKGIAADQTRCLQNQYFNRAHDFKIIAHLGSTIIFPRAHFLYKAGGTDDETPADNDPGFGYGSLRWPQVDIRPDRPNPAQSAFNAAIQAKAAKFAVDFAREKSDTDKDAIFDTAVDTSGTVETYFTIESANGRLIDVTFSDGTYGWGAAHPLTDDTSFLWWLDRHRELTAADVFLPNSGWQHDLVDPVIRSLKTDDPNQWFQDRDDDLRKSVAPAIQRPDSWSLSSQGLTITYGQYEIAPYAAGMPQVHLTWDELKPYLEPSLNPATLPAPEPKPNP